MSTVIPRLLQDEATAQQAVNALIKAKFSTSEIKVFTAQSGEGESLAEAISDFGVIIRHARVYAGLLAQGGALVVVRARALMAVPATRILRRFNPADVGIADPDYFEPSTPADAPAFVFGAPNTKLLNSDMSGMLISHDFSLFGFLGSVSNMAPFSKLATDMKPFSKLATDMKPFTKITAGGPSLPIPSVIRDEE